MILEITGTQAHEQTRETIVDFTIKNPRSFSAYLGRDLQEYLVEGGSPLQPKTWGTDVEILAAATLLQTPVVVYSAYRRWLTYKPLFALNDNRLESHRAREMRKSKKSLRTFRESDSSLKRKN